MPVRDAGVRIGYLVTRHRKSDNCDTTVRKEGMAYRAHVVSPTVLAGAPATRWADGRPFRYPPARDARAVQPAHWLGDAASISWALADDPMTCKSRCRLLQSVVDRAYQLAGRHLSGGSVMATAPARVGYPARQALCAQHASRP